MGNQYGITAAQRVYERYASFIRTDIVRRLMWKHSVTEVSEEEFMVDVTSLFFLNFYKYYENDKQYLSMVYVFGRNRIFTFKKTNKTHSKYVTADTTQIAHAIGLSINDNEKRLANVLEEVRDPSKHFFQQLLERDAIVELRKRVGVLENNIIDLLLEGLNIKGVCETLGITNATYNRRKQYMRQVLQAI